MVRISMRAGQAIMPWAPHDGRNADDMISARIPPFGATVPIHTHSLDAMPNELICAGNKLGQERLLFSSSADTLPGSFLGTRPVDVDTGPWKQRIASGQEVPSGKLGSVPEQYLVRPSPTCCGRIGRVT